MFATEMTKNIFILFLLTIGLLLGPMQTSAHNGSKVIMACCQKESTDSEKSCCKENQFKGKKHSCDSSCTGASCACPVVYIGCSLTQDFQEQNNSLFDFSDSKQNFFYSESAVSSDFRSIWLPPKLS